MFDPKALLDQFLGSNVPGTQGSVRDKASQVDQLGQGQSACHGGDRRGASGNKTGRSLGGSALKLGGMAAIAGLGYQAWKNYQAGKAPVEGRHKADSLICSLLRQIRSFLPNLRPSTADFALSLVRVMIAAARADGHVDDAERAGFMTSSLSGLGNDAVTFLDDELNQARRHGRHRRFRCQPRCRRWRCLLLRGLRSIPTPGPSAVSSTCWPAVLGWPIRWLTTSRQRSRPPRSDHRAISVSWNGLGEVFITWPATCAAMKPSPGR
jgi:uncharacterized membrane protein YebE (DUF533 family)